MRRLALHTAIVLATLTALLVLWQLLGVILMFFLSLATAAALRPLIQQLSDRGVPRTFALLGAYLVVFLVVAALILLLGPPLVGELQLVGDDFVHAYDKISTEWPAGTPLEKAIARRLPPPRDLLGSLVGSSEASVLQTVLGATVGFFSLIVHLVVVVVLSIYWSLDRVHFERLWLSLLAVDARAEAREVWRSIETEVGAYLRSEVLQSLAAGLLLGIGFALLGLPYPILLGIVGAVAWCVPWVGMLVSVTTVGVLSLPTLVLQEEPAAAITFAGGAAYTMLVLLLLEIYVEPRLFDRRRYNSLLIVVVVIGLAQMAGLLGVVLGPPLAAAIQILLGHLLRRRALATVSDGAEPALSVAKRAAEIRARIERLNPPPPELLSLSERLHQLITAAEQLGPASGRYAPTSHPADGGGAS
ncbi:MAG: AI-2E family transporter [Planctomycetaceae bacterium]|nr:AI-2E family transporter [Planctomycetaceae bacterium]